MRYPYYASGIAIFKRPEVTGPGKATMGFKVCEVADGVNAKDVARLLSKGELALKAAKHAEAQ